MCGTINKKKDPEVVFVLEELPGRELWEIVRE